MSKSISLTFGDFSCTVSGYDDPMGVVTEIARLFYDLPSQEFQKRVSEIVAIHEEDAQPQEVMNDTINTQKQDLPMSDQQAIERLLTQVEAQFRAPKSHPSSAVLAQLRAAAEQKQVNSSSRPNIFREETSSVTLKRTANAPLRLTPEQRIEDVQD